jgi:uncharacterized membrane protein YuzA (DUF378 family)
MKTIHIVAFVLVIVGGLNWLLVGVLGWDVGELFGGQTELVSRIIYILVGLSAIWIAVTHKKDCNCCESCEGSVGATPTNPQA